MLQQLARDIFGAPNVDVTAPSFLDGGVSVAGVTLSYSRLFIIGAVTLVVVAVAIYLQRTPAGRRMRAVMQNRPLAAVSAVRTSRVDRTTFFSGSGLAGIAGVGITLLGPVGPTLVLGYIIDAFLVVIVGGLGQLRGDLRRAVAGHGQLVHRIQHQRQGSRLPADRPVPAGAPAGPDRPAAPGVGVVNGVARLLASGALKSSGFAVRFALVAAALLLAAPVLLSDFRLSLLPSACAARTSRSSARRWRPPS
jgi:hypothetical protein